MSKFNSSHPITHSVAEIVNKDPWYRFDKGIS